MPHEDVHLPYTPVFSIITVSTSRYEENLKGISLPDPSGDLVEEKLRGIGISKILRYLIRDDASSIVDKVRESVYLGAEVIIVIGGSGVAPSDVSYNTLKSIIQDEITGYLSLFFSEAVKDVGSRVLPTRLIAGFYQSSLIFLLPGNLHAVKLAMEKIILNEYEHILWLRNYGVY